ncbi:MAG TPA: toxin-antitoxin system HicB family antitoxin [Candidatus Paceibacterota bacterium]|nr:toxin-antitoxin system HicB family antitoxin [Candidatus Paceibacterota bacterium]
MKKQTTLRLTEELANQLEIIARAQGVSVNQFIVDSLSVEIARVRKDVEFISRVRHLVERDQEILDQLAK